MAINEKAKNIRKNFPEYITDLQPGTKKKLIWMLVILGLGLLIFSIIRYKNIKKHDKELESATVKIVLVNIHDEKGATPEEDARQMKAGDVVAIFPEGHSFSDTERISFLILRMKLTAEWEKRLMEPELGPPNEEKEKAREAALAGNPDGNDLKAMEQERQETIRPRKYRINLKKLSFDPSKLDLRQPFDGKVFDDGIIEEKK